MSRHTDLSFIEKGEGFPVLLGHSYLFDNTMWEYQTDILAQHYRVIVPDLWGHGRSPSLPDTIQSLTDVAREHLYLMDRLDIQEFAIIGLSVGGMWGAELAVMAPVRVRALIMLDSFVGSESREQQQKYEQMLNTVDTMGAITSPLLEYIVSQFYSEYASEDDVNNLSRNLSSLSTDSIRNSIIPLGRLIFGRPDRMTLLDQIACPAHIAHGDSDLPRPPVEGLMMAERLGCGFSVIPRAGHISNRENPKFVNALITTFLEKHLPK